MAMSKALVTKKFKVNMCAVSDLQYHLPAPSKLLMQHTEHHIVQTFCKEVKLYI